MSARLSDSRSALLTGLHPGFVACLSVVAGAPGEQLLTDLDALSVAEKLADGSVPLANWLKNAVALAGPKKEGEIFARYLRLVHDVVARGLGAPEPILQLGHTNSQRRLGEDAAPNRPVNKHSDTGSVAHLSRGHAAYKLDPMYINTRRVKAITGRDVALAPESYLSAKDAAIDLRVRHARLLKRWLDDSDGEVCSFLEDRRQERLAGGRIFTAHTWFRFRNVQGQEDGPRLAHTTFSDSESSKAKLRLELPIEQSHIVEGSPGQLMTGTVSNLFVCAMVFKSEPSKVTAVPIFIGYKMTQGSWGQIIPAPRR